ncbi:unnamed protein product [Rotaria socialis]|uniref:RNA helicase n=1 Tax=Rotaria socialis TaxID=392032 RepID=A0A818Q2R9_9BILA|nr:unnamed protein product [Rotaria socialis]
MTDGSWDGAQASKTSEQQSVATPTRLGIGRGKPRTETNNDELVAPPPGNWNSNGSTTSENFSTFRSRNNDESNNPNSSSGSGGFGSRNAGGFNGGRGTFGGDRGGGSRGGYGSSNDSSPRACYNCNQTGHISRECSEPRKGNRGGYDGGNRGGHNSTNSRGGFHSGGNNDRSGFNSGFGNRNGFESGGGFQSNGSDRNVNFVSPPDGGSSLMSVTVNNDLTARGSSGFRGGRGGGGGEFNSSDRGFRGAGGGGRGGAGGNCYNWYVLFMSCILALLLFVNSNEPGHQARDCPQERKPRDSGSNSFDNSGGRRNNNPASDVFDQPGGHPTERFIPPPAPTTENGIFGEAVTRGENFGKYHTAHVQCTPPGKVQPIELYEEANLGTQILSNIRRAQFEEPTAIQRYTIPCIRQQDDIMACAQTGSGKTAAFLLPIISNLLSYNADELAENQNPPAPLCLIVSPTRELALQTEREARKFAFETSVIPCSAVGGHDMFTVSDRLRQGCHILSATTGRLKDMVEKGRISLKKVKYFVLDEADRMLDTGFEPDIRKLEDLGLPPKEDRCTSMFSATFPTEVQQLAKHFLRNDYVFLAVGTLGGANEDITQCIEEVPQGQKKDRLFQLLEQNLKSERCLIFVETKRSADYIGSLLSQKNFRSTTMHGDRTQQQRHQAVQDFTTGNCPILVATSVAARGLDFPLIGYVVNYDLPDSSDFYIHRIGRTGRAGHLGKSISFFDSGRDSDRKIAPDLLARLIEAGQEAPEFLKTLVNSGNVGFYNEGQGSRNTDVRDGHSHFPNRSKAAGPSGGTASAGAANENWD